MAKSNFESAAVRCPILSNPSNGRVTQQGSRPGARATYVCNTGYELVGLFSRICQNNGQWSGDAPTCESKPIKVYCGVFKKIIEHFYPIYSSLS